MSKKCIALVLLAALMTAALISCGNDSGGGGQAGTEPGAAETTTTAATTAYLDTLKGYDFKGAELGIIAQSVEGEQPTVPGTELTGEKVLDALYERDKTVQDMYNVKLVYTSEKYNTVTSRSQLTADLQAAILAGDCPWLFTINSLADGINNLTLGGYLLNLNANPILQLDQPWWNQNITETMTYNDKLFCQSGPISLAYYYSPCALAYNRTLAESYGIGDLYKNVADGSWTFDKFTEIIKDRSQDLNGDGNMTTDDFYAIMSDELSAAAFYIGVGGKQDAVVNGVPTFVVGEEANVSRIEKVAKYIGDEKITLRSEGLSGFTSYAVRKTNQFKTGKSLFCAYNMNGYISQLRDMEDDYGLIPNPKWDEKQERYFTYGSAFGPVGVAIPVTTTNTEMVGVVMESLAYLSYSDVGDLMFNVTLKEKVARDENSKLMLDIIYEDIIYDWTGTYSIGGVNTLVRDVCIGKKENISSEWASIKESASAKLKEILTAYDSSKA